MDLHTPLELLKWIFSKTKRLVVLLLGLALVGAGVAMVVLPGPGVLVIVAGLAVLATEFAFAEKMLDKTKGRAVAASDSLTSSRLGKIAFALSAASLIAGGGFVAILVDKYRVLGVSTLFAGVCALAILVPKVREWLTPTSSNPPVN